MNRSLILNEIMPFVLHFVALGSSALVGDLILHNYGLDWVGRYLGIPGTILILLSLLYSMRKRKVIALGSPRGLLRLHEVTAWLGSLMVLIHAGIHFNAILPWLALMGMGVNVLSGMIGRSLLEKSRRHLAEAEEKFRLHGMSKGEMEKELFWDAVSYDLMARWRAVHFPISFAFAAFALGHIVSVFLFWEWR